MQHHAKSSKIVSCQNQSNAKKSCKTSYSSGPCTHVHPAVIAVFSAKPCETSFRPSAQILRMRQPKKNWARKKRMASWARQQQQITEAADGGARACTGADGAVVLNLRRGPGACALLLRADGQLTRADNFSHLDLQGLRPQQPLIRAGPNDNILLRNGQKKLVRSLQGGKHRLTKLGKGFFRDKHHENLVHVRDHPWQAAQRAERGRGPRAQGLAAGERAGRGHEAPGTSRRSRWRSGSGSRWRPRWTWAAPSCSSWMRPASQHPEHALQELQDGGGDAPAPAHEEPEERELPAALQGGRAAERLQGSWPSCCS